MIICIANQKGGVGKTTTAVNLSSALSRRGFSVLLVDMDPQGNASSGLGFSPSVHSNFNLYDVLLGREEIKKGIQVVEGTKMHLVPTDSNLVGVQVELIHQLHREYRLKKALSTIEKEFDFIFIDCPPSLGLLTVNSFVAASGFLIPLQCEYYALEGLSQLLLTAGLIRKNFNPSLKLEGILLTMFDARSNLNHQVVSEVRSHFGDKVFETIISRNVRLSEAPGYGQSIFEYDSKALGAIQYKAFALEFEKRYRDKEAIGKELEAALKTKKEISGGKGENGEVNVKENRSSVKTKKSVEKEIKIREDEKNISF